MSRLSTLHRQIPIRTRAQHHRAYSTSPSSARSGHANWYASMLPGMIPVAILGSAVYMVSVPITISLLFHIFGTFVHLPPVFSLPSGCHNLDPSQFSYGPFLPFQSWGGSYPSGGAAVSPREKLAHPLHSFLSPLPLPHIPLITADSPRPFNPI
ncbi:hypothetical protein HYDPIDRAFT_104984 [Hydnomerulius pinastri MD-312]|nr:hypothetical protein HYDPIDRAFT_104984 [Hydnomerulius pinastri MD-312]